MKKLYKISSLSRYSLGSERYGAQNDAMMSNQTPKGHKTSYDGQREYGQRKLARPKFPRSTYGRLARPKRWFLWCTRLLSATRCCSLAANQQHNHAVNHSHVKPLLANAIANMLHMSPATTAQLAV